METVYLVQHTKNIEEEEEDVKIIGIYESEPLAKEGVPRLKKLPGFCDYPEGFYIDEYNLNQDNWTNGFITISEI